MEDKLNDDVLDLNSMFDSLYETKLNNSIKHTNQTIEELAETIKNDTLDALEVALVNDIPVVTIPNKNKKEGN